MTAAFLCPVWFSSGPRGLQSCRGISRQLVARSRAVKTPLLACAQGWAQTRLSIPSIEPSPAADPALPGVHFDEPPGITAEDLLQMIRSETPDSWVNDIVRTLLGWRQTKDGEWNDDLVPLNWKEFYPDGPPDFIGTAGDYTPATDRPVKKAVQRLTRTIPPEYKQIFKEFFPQRGFPGWTLKDLTPNRTRRATVANWILFWYRVHYPDYQWP